MPLWLALALPALPLQLASRALAQPGPLAGVEGPPQRLRIACCNDAARAAGIAAGQKLAAAQALARDLIAVERKPAAEHSALHELACWAYQFSAQIAARDDGLLLETGASERLFGGRAQLNQRIADELHALGYAALFGQAATPRAAWLVARARQCGLTLADPLHTADLRGSLAPLPLAVLDWDAAATDTLHTLGLATIGALFALPRDALNRRFGPELLNDLDRALGTQPDPQPLFMPPERFDAALELPADVTDAAQLMFPAHRLLRSLEGFLRGRGAGATELLFSARHNPRRTRPQPPTLIALQLAAPERDATRLAKLLTERLTRVSLREPAVALTLRVDRLLPFAATNSSWLPPSSAEGQGDWLQLAETLHARLGTERVFRLQGADDHRPECALRIAPLADAQATRRAPAHATPQRPLLLIETPQPLACRDAASNPDALPDYGGPLALVAGPERIEAGWWDPRAPQLAVQRDYFVARNPRGQTLWVYRELSGPQRWFLHGLFA